MKTITIMSKALCVSALLLPLALPIAAHAQTDLPPVTMSAEPSSAYQEAVVQSTPGVRYNTCLHTNTDYAFALNAQVNLAGAYSGHFYARNEGEYHVAVSPGAINGAQPATIPVTVSFRTPATATDEQANFFIDLVGVSRNGVELGGPPADDTSFVVLVPCVTDAAAQPTATPTSSAVPVPGNTIAFKLNVTGTPCANTTYWGYVGLLQSDPLSVRLTDADGDGVYSGSTPPVGDGMQAVIQLQQGTGVVSTPLAGDVPGAPSRVLADFGTQHADEFTYRVINDDFVAEASVNGDCSAAPSATATPSATSAPSATAQPSAAASATPNPSAPTTLPDTGAADTLVGGLLTAAAALATSGGYLLRRRARSL